MSNIARLYFIVPGQTVFAVDFREEAIYLPLGRPAADGRPAQEERQGQAEWRKIRVEADRLDAETIEGIVEAGTGKRVRLDADDLLIFAYEEPVDMQRTFSRLAQDYGIPISGKRPVSNATQQEIPLAGM